MAAETKKNGIKPEEKKKEEPKQESKKETKQEAKKEKNNHTEKHTILEKLPDETQKLFHMSNISLWLDRYEEIFSDFDPRPYSQRTLSDDFLNEAIKVSREKAEGKLELRLLLPAAIRNSYNEVVIKKRLKEHFKTHFEHLKKEARKVTEKGALFLVVGVILMLSASYILFTYTQRSFSVLFLSTLFEPASWFLFWEGLGLVVFKAKKKAPELEFYEKMSDCEIHFLSY